MKNNKNSLKINVTELYGQKEEQRLHKLGKSLNEVFNSRTDLACTAIRLHYLSNWILKILDEIEKNVIKCSEEFLTDLHVNVENVENFQNFLERILYSASIHNQLGNNK